MKKFILISFSILFFMSNSYAQITRPGWFITGKSDNMLFQDSQIESEEINDETEENYEECVEEEKDNSFLRYDKKLRLAIETLIHEFNLQNRKNIVVSPFSIYLTSVALANGIVDESLYEFSKLVSFLRLKQVNDDLFKNISNKSSNIVLNTAIWGDSFNTYYRQAVKKYFDVDVWNLQNTTDTINIWFSNKLNIDKENFIQPVPAQNEIYISALAQFKGNLQKPFLAKNTTIRIFHNIDGSDSNMQIMHQKSKMDYYEDDYMRAARLLFDSGDKITIVLPKENLDFYKFVENLDIKKLRPRFKKDVSVDLFLPRFKVLYKVKDTKVYYAQYGIEQVFKLNHHFAKMVSYDTETALGDIIWVAAFAFEDVKNNLNREEEDDIAPDERTKMFFANRPFIYMINDGEFIGIYAIAPQIKSKPIKKINKEYMKKLGLSNKDSR